MSRAPLPGLPCVFVRREVVIAAGAQLSYVDADWADALVVVRRGEVDLCGALGGSRRFGPGSVLFLVGLGLTALRNPGSVDTVLVATSRGAR